MSHSKVAVVLFVNFAGGSSGTYLAIQITGFMMKLEANVGTAQKDWVRDGANTSELNLSYRTDTGSFSDLEVLFLLSLLPLPQLRPFAVL